MCAGGECRGLRLDGGARRRGLTGNAYETAIGVGNVADVTAAWTAEVGAGLADGPVTAAGAVVVLSGDHFPADELDTGDQRFDLTLPGFPPPELGIASSRGSRSRAPRRTSASATPSPPVAPTAAS